MQKRFGLQNKIGSGHKIALNKNCIEGWSAKIFVETPRTAQETTISAGSGGKLL
jgi:hypothetical protein